MRTLRTLATGRELGTLRLLATGSDLGTIRTLATAMGFKFFSLLSVSKIPIQVEKKRLPSQASLTAGTDRFGQET